jgi:hypothetical protein
VGVSSPARILTRVDFPQPDGPITHMNSSRLWTEKETSERAVTAPRVVSKRFGEARRLRGRSGRSAARRLKRAATSGRLFAVGRKLKGGGHEFGEGGIRWGLFARSLSLEICALTGQKEDAEDGAGRTGCRSTWSMGR